MGLTRDLGIAVQALEERIIVTCAADKKIVFSTAGTTSTDPNVVQSTTAAGGINGRVLDRLDTQYGGGILTKATIGAYLWASRGSTEADRKLTLGIKLQHGDSSGGGDAADYSTGQQPTDKTFFTSAQTTPMANWSTGAFFGEIAGQYDVTAAKRYLRTVTSPSKNRVTTESSGDEHLRVASIVRFGGADEWPLPASTGAGSTTTST